MAPEKGVRLKISLLPNKCGEIPNGKMVHVSGVLHVEWTDTRSGSPRQTDKDSSATNKGDDPEEVEKFEVRSSKEEPNCRDVASKQPPTYACSEPKDSAAFECEQGHLAKIHQTGDRPTPGGAWDAVKEYFGKPDIGLFEEGLLYNGSTQIQPNPGGRYAILQTALGSFEIEGSPPLFHREVRSRNGTNLNVKISDVMGGIKIKFMNAMNTYAELKGGQIFRSASSGFAATSDFKHFQGHNAFLLIGGGIQPYGHEGARFSLRISLGWLYLPGTGEHMIRITAGPQFRF